MYSLTFASTIGTHNLKNHKLLNQWMIKGYIRPTDSFICLDKAVKKNYINLVQDRHLAAVCVKFSESNKSPDFQKITNILLRSKSFWLSTLYPKLIQKVKSPTGNSTRLYVHPQIALNYVLGTRISRRINQWQRQNIDIFCKPITPHYSARVQDIIPTINSIVNFFPDVETNLLVTTNNHLLHLNDDGNYWDLIICLENLAVGFNRKIIKSFHSSVDVDLRQLASLDFFSKRIYLPLEMTDLLRMTLAKRGASPTLILALKQLSKFINDKHLIQTINNSSSRYQAISNLLEI